MLRIYFILSIVFTIERTNFKNVILEFPKNMINPPLIWLLYLAFKASFPNTLGLMKSNGCVPLLNEYAAQKCTTKSLSMSMSWY